MKKLKLKNIIAVLLLVFGFYYLSLVTPSNKIDTCDGREQRNIVKVHFASLAHSVEWIQLEEQNECSYKWYALGYNNNTELYVHADYTTNGSNGNIEIINVDVKETYYPIK